jgi:hypothetical protein
MWICAISGVSNCISTHDSRHVPRFTCDQTPAGGCPVDRRRPAGESLRVCAADRPAGRWRSARGMERGRFCGTTRTMRASVMRITSVSSGTGGRSWSFSAWSRPRAMRPVDRPTACVGHGAVGQRDDVQHGGPDVPGPTSWKYDSGWIRLLGHSASRVAETQVNSLHGRALRTLLRGARIAGRVHPANTCRVAGPSARR